MKILYHKGISPTLLKDPIDDLWEKYSLGGRGEIERTRNYHSFIIVSSTSANLHIILKIFAFAYPNVDISKRKTHPWRAVIIERFQKRSNVMQIIKYHYTTHEMLILKQVNSI